VGGNIWGWQISGVGQRRTGKKGGHNERGGEGNLPYPRKRGGGK